MGLVGTIIGLIGFVGLYAVGHRWEKRRTPGEPPLVPPTFIQFIALLGALIFAAHLIAITAGISWQSPFRPSV